jgi:predicted outer membrane protein
MLVKYVLLSTVLWLGLITLGRAADQFPADAEFVRKAVQAGAQEIADSQSALAKSKDPAILAVAKQIQEEGSVVTQRLATLSVEKGWPTPTLDPPNTMSHYSDHRYVVRQIEAQQDALAFYVEEAANGADTQLQEVGRGTVPILRRRLASLRLLRTS